MPCRDLGDSRVRVNNPPASATPCQCPPCRVYHSRCTVVCGNGAAAEIASLPSSAPGSGKDAIPFARGAFDYARRTALRVLFSYSTAFVELFITVSTAVSVGETMAESTVRPPSVSEVKMLLSA